MPKHWEVEAARFLRIAEVNVQKRVQMFQPHDFKKQPELTDNQLSMHGALSPHKQHTEDFSGEVVEVHDGDTIKVQWLERDFPTKIRFANVAAAELGEGGEESKEWLKQRLLGKVVDIKINKPNRTGKYGRLLGRVFHNGMDIGLESALYGHVEVIR